MKIMGEKVITTFGVHSKCPTNFVTEPQCDIDILGSCVGRSSFHPTIRTSMLSSFVEEHCSVPQQWGNPSRHPWKFERDFVQNVGNPGLRMQSDALHWACDDWCKPIVAWCNKVQTSYQRLSLGESICGRDGFRWIDSMNKNTAIGFPLTGKKRDYLVRLDSKDWPEWNDPYGLGPELEVEVARILDCYSRNERAYPVFKSSPKVEPMPLSKDKKRLFQVAPTAFQVIVRMYFLDLAVKMSQCPLLSECSVGINCASDEWEQMAQFFEQFPTSNCIAGDYKNYDQRMGPDVTRAAWSCLIELARSLGASVAEMQIMECIVSDMVSPVIAFDGTLIKLNGSNPSGQNLTAHLNCVVNSLLLRCVWFILHRERRVLVPAFRSSVALQVYGDDNIATTSEPMFNMESISHILGRFGYVYTDAQKTLELVPFIPLEEAEYLKRKSVFHPKLHCRVGALTENSIFKSLHCFDTTCKVSRSQHAVAVLESAIGEFFLHGEQIYEARREQLKAVAEAAGLVVPLLENDYDTRVLQWLENYTPHSQVTTDRIPEACVREDELHFPKAVGFVHMGLMHKDTR